MKNEFPSDYQTMIHRSRYSRYLDHKNRRETWPETVSRYFDFMQDHLLTACNYTLPQTLRSQLEDAVLKLEIMPSMRAMMTAGPALDRCNVAGYNCSYIAVDSPHAFDEAMYVLLCGTGVGFSVERQFISQLPVVSEHFEKSSTIITVGDSKAGWARAFKELISLLYAGQIPTWDVSKVRPAGARLKTFGGRASGPEPLEDLFRFAIKVFQEAAGRKLNSIECHDLMCKVGEIVVVGGVRRSALISLSNLSDDRMRVAKSGRWWETDAHRALANNSVCYTEKPDIGIFMEEWLALYRSKSGERGVFNRVAAQKQAAKNGRRDANHPFGTNPCSEIILRPNQFCNLAEAVCRENDDEYELIRKVRLATILGTFQSTLTKFKYLRSIWKKNTEEERLLGVSLTGILDCKILRDPDCTMLERLKQQTIDENAQFAELLGIPKSTAITCVKPSGTVSQLTDSSSGIHPRHSEFYIRTVRGDKKDPLTKFLLEQGVPSEDCVMKPDTTTVFSFPVKAPAGSFDRNDLTAIQHLELWLKFQRHWCEHKPSITVSVREEEWLAVGSWVWEHFDEVSGISFLPHADHSYRQAPYQEVDEAGYLAMAAESPSELDWDRLGEYEEGDTTKSSQTLACTGSVCEVVDFGG